MVEILKKLALVNADGTVSITNTVVLIFTGITAMRGIFSGVTIDLGFFNWKIESLDLSSTLPLLFSLLNYHGKRVEINKLIETKETNV